MNRYCLFLISITLALVVTPNSEAHTVLKKPFQQQFQLKSASCFACHASGKDENGKRFEKKVLNDLGKDMKKLLTNKNFTDRIEKAKQSDATTKKKVYAEITEEFIEMLKKLEQVKSPDGTAWGPLIKAGEVEGVKTKAK